MMMPSTHRAARSSFILVFVLLVLAITTTRTVEGHARIECPPSLSGKTGEKVGPCDVSTDDGLLQSFPLRANALNTVTWLESIPHPGAPVRFALSREGGDSNGGSSLDQAATGFETCLLLDHVPHDALSRPTYRDESSWHRSSITLWIPDVRCERCYLQLISVMSDAAHGVPTDTKCAYRGARLANANTDAINIVDTPEMDFPACPAVYHSCSPVSIDGTIPRNDMDVCNTTEFEEQLGWPLTPRDNPDLYEHSIYYNRGDVGLYSTTDATLRFVGSPLTDATCTNPLYCDPGVSFEEILGVPDAAAYISLEGSCASVVESKVEAYVPPAAAAVDTTNGDSVADDVVTAVEEGEEKEETAINSSTSTSS
eukprot:CAMPEP_0194286820 /NCGR_PEP_ID=MMETSP0169-20130528/33373_1 /TAXON_ID=218684 /ORGANISM="Corethron pennatum, Strain L29A3" /LENGTH=368 /DNA_ID=CAMNT_0039033339 /DNA_START=21 /DNA_END=1124 /DNA_ORIENTATION=-